MRAFNNGKPQLSSSDRTRDIGVRNIFADTKSSKANATNYDGSIIYDTANSRVKRYKNYEMYRAVNYGYSLCEDCSGVCPAAAVDPEIQTENNQFSIMTFVTGDVVISANGDALLTNGGNNSALIMVTRAGGSRGVQLVSSTNSNADIVVGTTSEPAGGNYLRVWMSAVGTMSIKNVNAYTGPYSMTPITTQ